MSEITKSRCPKINWCQHTGIMQLTVRERQLIQNPSKLGGVPDGTSDNESTSQNRRHKRRGLNLWVGKIPWSRKWQPHSSILAWKNSMGRGAWWSTVHEASNSQTQLSHWAHDMKETTPLFDTFFIPFQNCVFYSDFLLISRHQDNQMCDYILMIWFFESASKHIVERVLIWTIRNPDWWMSLVWWKFMLDLCSFPQKKSRK